MEEGGKWNLRESTSMINAGATLPRMIAKKSKKYALPELSPERTFTSILPEIPIFWICKLSWDPGFQNVNMTYGWLT